MRMLFIPIALFLFSCKNRPAPPDIPPPPTSAQPLPVNGNNDRFEYTLQTAHPNAQALMKDDFFWSPIEETGPFGSDDGSDAAYGFRTWRKQHPATHPLVYLKQLVAEWKYPYFDWHEMDTTKIKDYMASSAQPDEATIQQQIQALKNIADTGENKLSDKERRDIVLTSARDMNAMFLLGQDNAIIGTGFAQFVLEGKIDAELKALTLTALKRQLLPLFINRYDADYSRKRKQQLTKMLAVIQKAGEEA